MAEPLDSWSRELEDHGIYADLSSRMTEYFRLEAKRRPSSIYSYALWRACGEVESLFGDADAVPAADATNITRQLAGPLKKVLTAWSSDENYQVEALGELLTSLWKIRNSR